MPVLELRAGGQIDLARLAAAYPERYPALLETGGAHGWNILFAGPGETRRLMPGDADAAGFLTALAPALPATTPTRPPFLGGWLLYLAYELGSRFEPSVPARDIDTPLAIAARMHGALLARGARAWLVAEPGHEHLIDQLRRDIGSACTAPRAELPALTSLDEEPDARFLDGVARIQDYIRAGDVFQVNLSRAWRARFVAPPDPAALYLRLRAANPAPFAALARFGDPGDTGDFSLISSSPERLVKVRGRAIETLPIAGTHPRDADPARDEALRARLIAHPKERAEHIMLVDLERNDLGRVCAPGSVRVPRLLGLTRLAHVHHIESTVRGRLRAEVGPSGVIRALFPGGTITGCPKVRTMQIIREIEGEARGTYTGSLGFLSRCGTLDLNILIRTLTLRGAQADFRAGAGIVADSVAVNELDETRHKARGIIQALSP
jgi:anthranilate synthase component 1